MPSKRVIGLAGSGEVAGLLFSQCGGTWHIESEMTRLTRNKAQIVQMIPSDEQARRRRGFLVHFLVSANGYITSQTIHRWRQ